MSDLQRSFAKAQLSRLPAHPPPAPLSFNQINEDEEDEAQDGINDLRPPASPNDDSSSASSASSTGTIVPSPSQNLFERPRNATTKANRCSPLPWDDFFAQELFFTNSNDATITHHAYLTPPSAKGPLIVTHHGAGSSALSFATFFKSISTHLPSAGILSIDARSHGLTTSPPSTPLDLSLETLSSDLLFVLSSTAKKLSWDPVPPIVLIGHSLGGAVIAHVASTSPPPTLLGMIMLDIVEGSALEGLAHMETFLSTRPTSFPSIATGIDWHLRSRTIRNTSSARISVPPLLTPSSQNPNQVIWRTDLRSTLPFWQQWFEDLSAKFLAPPSSVAKLLILAGTDRLDKPLTIAQMQGKYQLHVVPEAGHFVHEDCPEKVAVVVAEFWKRNDRSAMVLPPKVDDLIRQGKVKGKVVHTDP
jgi:protein phosphatase methylesterase 1